MMVFVIMTIFYTLLGSKLISLMLLSHNSSFYHQHHTNNEVNISFDRLYSYVAFHRFTQEGAKKTCAYVAIILFNVIVVFLAVKISWSSFVEGVPRPDGSEVTKVEYSFASEEIDRVASLQTRQRKDRRSFSAF